MSIRPIDFNGMVQRTQDMGTLKQNEDNKPVVDQHVFSVKVQKDAQQNLHQVNRSEESQNNQKKYDAREKGSNQYQGSFQEGRKDKKKSKDKVVKKNVYEGFDIKI